MTISILMTNMYGPSINQTFTIVFLNIRKTDYLCRYYMIFCIKTEHKKCKFYLTKPRKRKTKCKAELIHIFDKTNN